MDQVQEIKNEGPAPLRMTYKKKEYVLSDVVARELFKWVKSARNGAAFAFIGLLATVFLSKVSFIISAGVGLTFMTISIFTFRSGAIEYNRLNEKYKIETPDFLNNMVFRRKNEQQTKFY